MNNTYVVQKGDTLYGISKQHNTSVQKLRELNNLKSDILVPSQILIISDNSDYNPSECVIYTVEKGDSLYSIAKRYDTTVAAIKRYNNLTSNNLYIGQRLKMPCYMDTTDSTKKPDYVTYIVEKGDSLYSIAKKFGTTVDKIKEDNKLKSNNLDVGMVLLIDDVLEFSSIEECYGSDDVTTDEYETYKVKKGDSLYSIAKRFGTTVDEIKRINGLSTNNLYIGQELQIPGNDNTYYIVEKGDSLYSIAKKFGTTVDSIKAKNNLSTNLLSIGQQLLI